MYLVGVPVALRRLKRRVAAFLSSVSSGSALSLSHAYNEPRMALKRGPGMTMFLGVIGGATSLP